MKLFNSHVEDRFAEYLDSRMNEADKARFEEHLRSCDYCRLQYEATRQSVIALRSLPIVDVPRAFVLNEAMLAETPRRQPSRASRWQPIAAPAAGFAVLSLLLFGGDLATSGDGDSASEAPAPFEASTENTAREEGGDAPVESFAEEAETGAEGDAADGGAQDAEPVAEEGSVEAREDEEAEGQDDTSIAAESSDSGGNENDSVEPVVIDSDVDDDEDDLRLYVRILAGLAGALALVLAALSLKRWLEQRKTA